jgi:hypothetical protein
MPYGILFSIATVYSSISCDKYVLWIILKPFPTDERSPEFRSKLLSDMKKRGFDMRLFVFAVLVLLSGCATSYQKQSVSGGYSDMHLEEDIYRVVFDGNGYTSRETVQTYWLYRCASLALEKSFDGFEILSHIELTQQIPPEELLEPLSRIQKAYVILIPFGGDMYKPKIEADIRLLKSPVTHKPPNVFDARILKNAIETYVTGEKCEKGNICTHAHIYVY